MAAITHPNKEGKRLVKLYFALQYFSSPIFFFPYSDRWMDSAVGNTIFLFHPPLFRYYTTVRSPTSENSDPEIDSDRDASTLNFEDDDIRAMLNPTYGSFIDQWASQMIQGGQSQKFCDSFQQEHEKAFEKCWRLLGINVPLNPDELQLMEITNTAENWCLALNFSDKMLTQMENVLQEKCSSENSVLVMDCFRRVAESTMKHLLKFPAVVIKTESAFHYFQQHPDLLIHILTMYKSIDEARYLSNEDRHIFRGQLADKVQPMLSPDVLLNVHNMGEAHGDNGGIHNNTRKLMIFIGRVIKYDKVLTVIGLPHGYKRNLLVNGRDVRIDLLLGVIPKLLPQILSISKTLQPDLLLIMEMNNTWFILDEVFNMGLDRRLQIWARYDQKISTCICEFINIAWSGVQSHLNSSTGFFPLCWKSQSVDMKGYIRAFEQTCLHQQDYVVPDNNLRERVQNAIIEEIVPPYKEAYPCFASSRERREKRNSPEVIEGKIKELYEGRLLNLTRAFR